MPPLTPISPLAWFPAEQQDPWDTGLLGSEGGIPPPPTPPAPRHLPLPLYLPSPASFIVAGSEWIIISSGASLGLSPLLLW